MISVEQFAGRLQNCSCGRSHCGFSAAVVIGSGVLKNAGRILKRQGFPSSLLLVCDRNTLAAAAALPQVLASEDFSCSIRCYEDLRVADLTEAERIASLCGDFDGVLSVGTGSLNDICRYGAAKRHKPFAIFATAPSMDGFASAHSPLTDRNFKRNYDAAPPSVMMGDTSVLAAAPTELKAAGFGDIMAKFIALADWQISSLLTGEDYCPTVAALTRSVAEEVAACAADVSRRDDASAGAIMNALVLTGAAMTLAGTPRPASGAEHDLSHFWEIKALESGQIPEFHGKTVAVATVLVNRVYHLLAETEQIFPRRETLNWERIDAGYGPAFSPQVHEFQHPPITDSVSLPLLAERWPQIREIIRALPSDTEMTRWLLQAGAAVTPEEIALSAEECITGLRWHPYMRSRITLLRVFPMLGIPVDFRRCLPSPIPLHQSKERDPK